MQSFTTIHFNFNAVRNGEDLIRLMTRVSVVQGFTDSTSLSSFTLSRGERLRDIRLVVCCGLK